MLILTRKPNETIKIGTDIYIKILEVRGKQVRVGLSAPQDVHIVRTELLAKQTVKNKSYVQKIKEIASKDVESMTGSS